MLVSGIRRYSTHSGLLIIALLGTLLPQASGTASDIEAAPSDSLYLVPREVLGGVPKSTQLIHDYGAQSLVTIPKGDEMPVAVRSHFTQLQDVTVLQYRGYKGIFPPFSEKKVQEFPDGYYLVALAGPLDSSWWQSFVRLGITVVDTASPYALLVRADGGRLVLASRVTTSRGYSVLRGVIAIPSDARVDPTLLPLAAGTATPSDIPGLRKSPDGRAVVRVLPHADRKAADVVAEIAKFVDRANAELAWGQDDAILIRGSEIPTIIDNVAGVGFLEAVKERQLHNNIGTKNTVLNVEPVWALGYNGTGIIVDHNDSGVDSAHPDFPAGTIVATNGTQSGTDNGHGTHTAGSVLGRGLAGASPTNTSGCGDVTAPLGTVRGSAWGARLVTNNLFVGGLTAETSMMQWGYQNGARLSTNSWGYTNTYTYNSGSVAVDTAVRDADAGTAGNQELCILFSAGNSGPGASTVGAPGTGKNAITVGASQNDRCGSYVPTNCAGPSINSMACFSSRGPAQGRIKPDIVATGTDILSTQSSDAAATHPWDQAWTGARYEIDSGTSMSCPLTAGAAATFFSFFSSTFGSLPSPALAKAALINGAVDMGLGYPSYDQGWGRLNLLRSVQGPPGGSIAFIDQAQVTPLATGGTWSKSFQIGVSTVPLKVTLVWTDPPSAAGCSSCLTNDLNLVVTAPGGTVYRGNRFTANWSTPNPGATTDIANNVENIFVQSPAVGIWTIQVTSASTTVNPQGLTGQDFAVVYSGNFCATPSAPTGPAATATGSNQVTVGWAAPVPGPAPTEYHILRATTTGGPYVQVGVTVAPGTSFLDTTVSGGVTYFYVIRSFNSCESANSAEASVTATGTCTVPPTFAGLSSVTATPGATCTLTLAWAAATSSCGGTITYNVYRSTTAGFTPSVSNRVATDVTGTSFVDSSGLVSGTTHYYIVRAVDSANAAEDTNSVQRSGAPQGALSAQTWTDDGGDTGLAKLSVQATWTNAATGGRTGPRCYATGTYGNSACFSLTTPVLNVNTGGGTLTFYSKYDIEAGWDKGQVELSTDGGATWSRLAVNYPATSNRTSDACGFPGANTAYFTGNNATPTWASYTATVPAGANTMIRWRLSTDVNTTAAGWWIDDISLTNVMLPGSCNSAANDVQFFAARATGGAAAGSGQVKLMWWTPAGTGAYPYVRVLRKAAPGVPSGPNDGTSTVVGTFNTFNWGSAGSAPDSGLTNNTTYNYAAYVSTNLTNWSSGKLVSSRPQDTTGKTKWVYSTGAAALAAPARDVFVYAVSNDRILHGVNGGAAGGDWPASWRPLVLNAPAQDRFGVPHVNVPPATKVIFLGSQDGKAYSVNADTGLALKTSNLLSDSGGMIQGALGGNFKAYDATALDLVFAGTRNSSAANKLWALDVLNLGGVGGSSFSFDNGGTATPANAFGFVSSQPSVDYVNKRVYFATRKRLGGSQQTVWCVTFTSSAFAPCPSFAPSTSIGDVDGAVIPYGGYLYVGDNAGIVWILDSLTGATKGSFATNDGAVKGFIFPDFLATPKRLYCSTNGKVWAFTWDGTTMASVWTGGTGGVAIASPSIPTFDGTSILVGSNDGRLHQITNLTATAPTHTSMPLGAGTAGTVVGSPTLDYAVPNLLYVGTDSGLVYAVQYPIP